MNEMPDNIERIFEKQGLNLLLGGERDLRRKSESW
jgi:uncharacterized Zn finger protein